MTKRAVEVNLLPSTSRPRRIKASLEGLYHRVETAIKVSLNERTLIGHCEINGWINKERLCRILTIE